VQKLHNLSNIFQVWMFIDDRQTDIHLTASFLWNNLGKLALKKVKSIRILMKQEMMGWS